MIIGPQVTASSSGLAAPWECSFQLRDKALPSNSFLQTQRSGEGGQVSDSLGQALLLPTDMEHYFDYRDSDLVLKLKWHMIAICFASSQALLLAPLYTHYCDHYPICIHIHILVCSFIYFFIFLSVTNWSG